ncbi:hypothetical protein Pan216_10910 [Planctomycetes bacterium Pan216]|uniref:Carboxypeptidase regulatory-like domain-containing protein n=1 Tax=Kolteria novifilia TaxID=2527975 RepID=A0A518AZX0_9BACT|nr:hypothetical protein Pan216_10910 [Planctomycetes bacterium Pan216]
MIDMSRIGRDILVILGCSLLGACGGLSGPPRCAVSGEVTVDGAPVEQGAITFVPHQGTSGPVAGGAIVEGRFAISERKGPLPGKYLVRIRGSKKTGRLIDVPPDSVNPDGEQVEEIIEIVPTRYNEASDLVRELVPGDNRIAFELSSS